MYSVFLPTRRSGNWLGAHQKFDRLAYRLVVAHVQAKHFPALNQILHFEGFNGPDGLIAKSPGQHEPRHYYDPIEDKGPVLEFVQTHYDGLVEAFKKDDQVKSSFELAWLGHAVTDGLTPAHHFPYVETVEELHALANHRVKGVKDKLIIRGETGQETLKHTFKYWGKKGMAASHTHFEAGVAATIAAYRFGELYLHQEQIEEARALGHMRYFKRRAKMVARLNMYDRFIMSGWTVGLARQTRHVLAPIIVETVATMWLLAYEEAHGPVHYQNPPEHILRRYQAKKTKQKLRPE